MGGNAIKRVFRLQINKEVMAELCSLGANIFNVSHTTFRTLKDIP